MVATMSIMSTSAPVQLGGLKSLPRLHRAGQTRSTAIRRNLVCCEAGESDQLRTLRKAVDKKQGIVDKNTKDDLTKDIILRNQDEDISEKRSVFGAVPSSGSFYPRPEIDRRPETGDRSFGSLFCFDGAAPETINGRLAMLGFVWALAAEKATGLTVLEQVFNPGVFGLVNFVGVTQLFTFASLVPFMMGESTDARHWGIFNAKAERWNGRLAMLGFAALIMDEAIRGSPFFSCLQNWLPGH